MSHTTRSQSLTSISPSISGRNRPNPRQARRGGCRAASNCRFSTSSVSGCSSRRRSFGGFARSRASETSLIVSITSNRRWREAVCTKSSEGILEGEDDAGEGVSTRMSESWFDRFLKLPEDGSKIWKAPWGKTVMIQVMVMWFVAFCTVGNAVFPYAAGVLGFDTSTFTQRGLAFYSLCLDFAQMLTTVFILRQSLRPFQPLAENWFSVKWPKDRKWLKDVALACLAFPVVVWLHGASTSILEHFGILVFDENVSSAWEQSMKSNDVVSKVFYMLLASFCGSRLGGGDFPRFFLRVSHVLHGDEAFNDDFFDDIRFRTLFHGAILTFDLARLSHVRRLRAHQNAHSAHFASRTLERLGARFRVSHTSVIPREPSHGTSIADV